MNKLHEVVERIKSLAQNLESNQQKLRDACHHPDSQPQIYNYSQCRALCYCPDCYNSYFRHLNSAELQEIDRRLNHSATV